MSSHYRGKVDTQVELGRKYLPRVIDSTLVDALASAGAVVIEGARASGKTMTALNVARSHVFIDAPEVARLLDVAPRSVLEGAAPRLLDEWQLAPELWNLVRRSVDASAEPGRFILTGSAAPADDLTRHSGAGRFIRIRQFTMTWWEKSGDIPSRRPFVHCRSLESHIGSSVQGPSNFGHPLCQCGRP